MVSLRFLTKILIIFAILAIADGRSCRHQLERAVENLEKFLENTTMCNNKEEFLNHCKPKLISILIHLPLIDRNSEVLLDHLANSYNEELFASICIQ